MIEVCDCSHIGEMHYGSEKAQCNTPNCRCLAFRIRGKFFRKVKVGATKTYGGSFLSELREEIREWHANVFDEKLIIEPEPSPNKPEKWETAIELQRYQELAAQQSQPFSQLAANQLRGLLG